VFLDRDGVLIEERNYLADPAGVQLILGAARYVARANACGRAVVVVSNQSGIARGILDWRIHLAIENRMIELLAAQSARIDMLLACGHHPDGAPPLDFDHPWRKPKPGMLLEAAGELNLDLSDSLLVGDKRSDIEAARAGGLPAAILVLTGYGRQETSHAMQLQQDGFAVSICASIADAPVAPWPPRHGCPAGV
jgi:D-glycero-D-manno-heptose 1,7-bisphosphate phosphatase